MPDMLCVSISPKLPGLAKVDLLNAARQADLIELCLDAMQRPIDVRALLAGVPKPVIVSCRRVQDGGQWDGSEAERLALLREAAAGGPAYVELDADAARQVPRLGGGKRIISFTSLDAPLDDLPAKIDRAANVSGDIVKFAWPTPTLDAAWPLLAVMSRKTALPVVGLGLGSAGRTLSLLGCKYRSPWLYAALEQGMEAYPGQPTVQELDEVYHWRGITAQTRLLGVAGFGPSRLTTLRLLNEACRLSDIDMRCVPLEVGDFGKLRRMLDLLRIGGVAAASPLGEQLLSLADHADESVQAARHADLQLRQDDGWHAYSLLWRTTLKVVRRSLRRAFGQTASLDGANVLLLGTGEAAQSLLYGLRQAKASVAVAGRPDRPQEVQFCKQCGFELEPEPDPAGELARRHGARHIPFEALGESRPEVLIVAEPALRLGYGPTELNPVWLRAPLVVVDVTRIPEQTDLLVEARQRGCLVVRPTYLFAEQLAAQFKLMTGQDLPPAVLHEAIDITERA